MVEGTNNTLSYQVTKQGKLVEGSPMGIITEDRIFPLNDESVGLNNGAYEWLRPDQISGFEDGTRILSNKLKPDEVTQGNLGDCYFVSALSVLAEKPERIKNLFESSEVNSEGIYRVKMLRDGIWTSLKVDDSLPCKSGRPAFAHSRANELWVSLVEKAAAQKYGSYAKLHAGNAYDPMADLTGAPTMSQLSTDSSCWNFLLEAEKCNNVMTALALKGDSSKDIVPSHSYAILKVAEVEKDGQPVRLLQVRNPHGCTEWNGDWSDNSQLWTEELKKELGWVNRDDGSFFINFEDFKKYYEGIEICWVNDNYTYSACPIDLGVKGWAVVSVKLETDCEEVYVKVTQTDKRQFSNHDDLKYPEVDLKLYLKDENEQLRLIGENSNHVRDIRKCLTKLKAGEYLFYVRKDAYSFTESQRVCLSFYSDQLFAFQNNETDSYADRTQFLGKITA